MADPALEGASVSAETIATKPGGDIDHDWLRQVDGAAIAVGVADGAIATGGTLRTSGLGSCVAVAICDWVNAVGGLVHPMLPAPDGQPTYEPGRYVATAVPALIEAVRAEGGSLATVEAVIVGGATMIDFTTSGTSPIGERNVAMADKLLADRDITIDRRVVGGSSGRSFACDLESGEVSIREAVTGTASQDG